MEGWWETLKKSKGMECQYQESGVFLNTDLWLNFLSHSSKGGGSVYILLVNHLGDV